MDRNQPLKNKVAVVTGAASGIGRGAAQVLAQHGARVVVADDLTSGFGADVAIECAGAKASLDQCIRAARKGAQLVLVGLFGHPVEVNVDQAVIKEFTVLPSFTYEHRTWRRAIQLLAAGKLQTAPLVSGSFPITEWERAFEAVKSKQGSKYQLLPVN